MQKISLYLIVILTSSLLLNTYSAIAKRPDVISVRLFSKLNKIENIEIKSSTLIFPLNKTLAKQREWKIKIYSNKLALENSQNKVKHYLPEKITLKPDYNKQVCISSSNIPTRCYRGIIDISYKRDRLDIINKVQTSDYLNSTVSSEIPRGWPIEAVKAQTIVAHTFLLNKLEQSKAISDSTQDQFYGGTAYENPDYKPYIQEVKNIIITNKDNQVIEALYHSTCAGHTLNNEQVFGNKPKSYLRSVPCSYDKESNFAKTKTFLISHKALKDALKTQSLIFKRDQSGKLKNVQTDYANYNAYQFWLKLGQVLSWHAVPGIKYDIKCSNNTCKLSSIGAGHAVGFCQWGAKGMAEQGFKYPEILNHYYKNIIFSYASR